MVKKIILVFKTHFDIGFTDLAENVIRQYGDSMLREVIATCNATRHMGSLKYVWTMPAWPLRVITQSCQKELKPELDRLIREGQIIWHALPFTSHTDICSEEEYIEGLRYAKELSEEYHKPYPISAKMTDVPGHGIMLPEILGGAGVKFLHLGCNQFATPPEVPFLFQWEAASGKRVLTMYSRGGYGTSLLPPEDWKYPVWMALMQTHDNSGPQSAGVIEEMAARIHEKYPDTEVVCGSMDDFYHELAQADLSEIPVIRQDLADTWIHGIAAYPGEVSLLRSLRRNSRELQCRQLESWLDREILPAGELQERWKRYYEQVALFEEHTWGADVKTWLGPDRVYEKRDFQTAKKQKNYQFMESSWEEQRTRIQKAEQELMQIGEELTGHGAGGDRNARENTLELQRTPKGICVGNAAYELFFSEKTGSILSLTDAASGKELLHGREQEGIFQYQYDRYGIDEITQYLKSYAYRYTTWGIQDNGREAYPECRHKRYLPDYMGYEVQGSSLLLHYRCGKGHRKYGDADEVLLTVTFPSDGRELEVTLQLKGKTETPYVESGSILFPFAAEHAVCRINKSGAELDVSKDIVPKANHVLYALEDYMTLTEADGAKGLCIITKDAPLMALGETGIYQYRDQFEEPLHPTAYFNLFNNMWGTNFPQWLSGDFTYRFTLFGFAPKEQKEVMQDVHKRMQSPEEARLSGLPEGMQLIYTGFTEQGMLLRLRDLTGCAGTRTLKLPDCELQQTDLLERPIGDSVQGELPMEVDPYGIYSVIVRRRA